jgi:hypothetical protein
LKTGGGTALRSFDLRRLQARVVSFAFRRVAGFSGGAGFIAMVRMQRCAAWRRRLLRNDSTEAGCDRQHECDRLE